MADIGAKWLERGTDFVSDRYLRPAQQNLHHLTSMFATLLSQQRLPDEGWSESTIEFFLAHLSAMDSNNFIGNVGAGEREARIFSPLVQKRHYNMGHGVGRSGNIDDEQPKAAGSSLMAKLCVKMAMTAIKAAGVSEITSCLVLPLATGMTITMALLALKKTRVMNARKVIWFRIDQKTCFKAIHTAGLEPIVVQNVLEGDELRTDIEKLRELISSIGPEEIVAVISTTSCFAPRAPEKIEEVSRICKEFNVPHLVNHAYGLQSEKMNKQLSRASRVGRIDGVVSSTDKNFMVPVGGALLFGLHGDDKLTKVVSSLYPGRACGDPMFDLFVTLLSMGKNGYVRLLNERKENFVLLKDGLKKVAEKHGERVLETPNNEISMGMTLQTLAGGGGGATFLGSMLFARFCSGMRAVSGRASQDIAGTVFTGFGAHCDAYPFPYLTAACAIGMTRNEISIFLSRLESTLLECKKKMKKIAGRNGPSSSLSSSSSTVAAFEAKEKEEEEEEEEKGENGEEEEENDQVERGGGGGI